MSDPTREALPCAYIFALSGGRCHALPGHVIHRGRWAGPEPNHDYQPVERRKADRRAALSTTPAPLDVRLIANAILGGSSYKPHREAAERVLAALEGAPHE